MLHNSCCHVVVSDRDACDDNNNSSVTRNHTSCCAIGARRHVRQEDILGIGDERSRRRQIATVPTHALDHERAPMRVTSRLNAVDRVDYSRERTPDANGRVSAKHVVVDCASESNEVERGATRAFFITDESLFSQSTQVQLPLTQQHISACTCRVIGGAARLTRTQTPVKLPSPPIQIRPVIPVLTKFSAAFLLPSIVLNEVDRAVPMIVPPREMIPPTSPH
jgi:hypothetical protein